MDAAARFSEFLARNRLRLTQERRTILDEMLQIHGHFDADSLLVHFRRKGRTVSRATLYRTLARLVEAAWTVFARVAAGSPAELRKGPRGGVSQFRPRTGNSSSSHHDIRFTHEAIGRCY